jgi:glycosyltransferase involved in cell wall biosynthesis
MNAPRLSFVVPVYKPKVAVFEKHVKALRDQALKSWDVCFVLDGPSTEARSIINQYLPDARIEEIVHQGAQAARNHGGALAQGDFLCFLDSDCVLEPGASQMWVEQFDKRPHVGFIYSGYKFFGEKYAIESEAFDPWTLKIRNYVSGCFPMRKSLYPGWAPELKSLQDWDMWLSLLKKAEAHGYDVSKVGMYIRGYAFATSMPEPDSISGQGCTPENWLERYEAVKKRQGLPDRKVCVTAIGNRHDGITLAKLIDADYLDYPNDKPNRYQTIIQIGFSLGKGSEKYAENLGGKGVKKFLFWTSDNINEMYNAVSFRQIDAISQLLNEVCTQFCEDKEAQWLLKRAGFKAKIMPIPLGEKKSIPVPEVKKWLVDASGDYSPLISVISQSLPDIPLELAGNASDLSDYVGLLHFYPDRTLTTSIKRAILTGRHVIANVDAPDCVAMDDKGKPEKFVVEVVGKIRELSRKPFEGKGEITSKERLLEAVGA